jgi:multicomponent Na+:H+ antiporter subunit F
MDLIQRFDWLFYGILSVQAMLLLFCLVRAGKGPRIADRLVAVNMMGTLVMVMIAILAVVKDQGYLVDICLIYAMISFLAVVVLSRIYTGVYRDAKAHEKKKGENKHADS